MIYIATDIHGNYDYYEKLKSICLKEENDKIIILGDVIDRGEDGIKILLDIMTNKNNIELIMGNHERFLLDYYMETSRVEKDYIQTIWFSNGGQSTLKEFKKLSKSKQLEIIHFLFREVEYYKMIKYNNVNYLLSHTIVLDESDIEKLKNKDDDSLWNRSKTIPNYPLVYNNEEYINIFGHTPVQHYLKNQKEKEVKVIDNIYYIDLDCGLAARGYDIESKLSIYDLYNNKVQYVEIN